jgi:hypothetical protein
VGEAYYKVSIVAQTPLILSFPFFIALDSIPNLTTPQDRLWTDDLRILSDEIGKLGRSRRYS